MKDHIIRSLNIVSKYTAKRHHQRQHQIHQLITIADVAVTERHQQLEDSNQDYFWCYLRDFVVFFENSFCRNLKTNDLKILFFVKEPKILKMLYILDHTI